MTQRATEIKEGMEVELTSRVSCAGETPFSIGQQHNSPAVDREMHSCQGSGSHADRPPALFDMP